MTPEIFNIEAKPEPRSILKLDDDIIINPDNFAMTQQPSHFKRSLDKFSVLFHFDPKVKQVNMDDINNLPSHLEDSDHPIPANLSR